jgi:hypothetical protein
MGNIVKVRIVANIIWKLKNALKICILQRDPIKHLVKIEENISTKYKKMKVVVLAKM